MKFSAGQLLRPTGTVDRGPYVIIGLLGFAIKHNLDRLVAWLAFHRPWDLFNYWVPIRNVAHITQLSRDEQRFLACMMLLALPFIWIGVVLTVQRLRSANLPPKLVALFFVPFANLAFFLFLSLIPQRDAGPKPAFGPHESWMERALPSSALGSAAVSLVLTVSVGLGVAVFAARILRNYGWGLFVALPFVMGFVAAGLHGSRQPRRLASSIGVASLSVALLGASLLALAVEGLVCLVMAIPIALPLAMMGGFCANRIQKRRWLQNDAPVFLSWLLFVVPGIEWMEHASPRPAPVFVVRTALNVQAPPARVWSEVIAFTQIPAPKELMFRAGIAYPVRAEMIGTGIGAERHCVFSTGSFVEPIQVWDEPRLLKFAVTANPPPMQEWTPYTRIDPPHLHGFLVSEGGQFSLTPLPNGGTRLEGTTWYQHRLWPSAYWRLWSDAIIHQIHLRVLRHIREEAELRTRGVSQAIGIQK